MRQVANVLDEQAVVATATDVGCVRRVNEDAVHVIRATAYWLWSVTEWADMLRAMLPAGLP